MTETLTRAPATPAPRKRDAGATRAAILQAAQRQFALNGFDKAVLRSISGEAGVDVALVKRYFGDKEALFVEALQSSFRGDALRDWNRATFARDVAATLAGSPHDDADRTQRFQFLLRAATSPTTAHLLSGVLQDRFLGPIRQWLGGKDAEARARVLAACYIGLLVERLVRGAPLRGRERAIFISRVTETFEHLIQDRASD